MVDLNLSAVGISEQLITSPLDLLLDSILQLVAVDGTLVLAHKDRQKSRLAEGTSQRFFQRLDQHFAESVRVKVEDMADLVGQTGGDITEEAGVWLCVFRGLQSKND